MRKRNTVGLCVLLAAVAIVASGCGNLPGKWTPANAFQNYPPEIRGVDVNLEASLVSVDFQPTDGSVKMEGWFILPDESNRRRITFAQDVIHSTDSRHGRALFVIASYDWPSSWLHPNAMERGIKYFFMVTVRDPDGYRTVAEVWQHLNGETSRVS